MTYVIEVSHKDGYEHHILDEHDYGTTFLMTVATTATFLMTLTMATTFLMTVAMDTIFLITMTTTTTFLMTVAMATTFLMTMTITTNSL